MEDTAEPAILAIVKSIARLPGVGAAWTELDANGHRIWLARGANGHPWLLATDNLQRFRGMIAGIQDDEGSCG